MAKNILFRQALQTILVKKGTRTKKALLKHTKNAMDINKNLLFTLLENNKNTEYGQKYNFKDIHTIEEYKKNVPLTDYEDYKEYTKRMYFNKETNILTSDTVLHYNLSSATTGEMKYIPYTKKAIEVNQSYGSLPNLLANLHGDASYNTLKLPLMFCIVPHIEYLDDKTTIGYLSERMVHEYRWLLSQILFSPIDLFFTEESFDTQYYYARFALETPDFHNFISTFSSQILLFMKYIIENQELLIHDIETGEISDKVDMSKKARQYLQEHVSPNPQRASFLRKEFAKGTNEIFSRIWPSLSSISTIGNGGFASYTRELRTYLSEKVKIFHYGYIASEGIFAVCIDYEDENALLIPDSCFYEFLPIGETDPCKTKTLDELIPGEEYEFIITNQSGFYRYRMKDIIKVERYCNNCPMIHFSRRKNQCLNAVNEKVTETLLDSAFIKSCEALDVTLKDYVVTTVNISSSFRYNFFIELNTNDTTIYKQFARIFFKELKLACPLVERDIKAKELSSPSFYFLPSNSFREYKKTLFKDNWNQSKLLHIYDDPRKLDYFYNCDSFQYQCDDIPNELDEESTLLQDKLAVN